MEGLYRRRVDLPAEPRRLAQSLQGLPGAFWLDSSFARKRAVLGAFPLRSVQAWDPEPDLPSRSEARLFSGVPRWLGLIPYEACRHAAGERVAQDGRRAPSLCEVTWWRYGAVVIIDDGVEVVGDDRVAVERLAAALAAAPRPLEASLSPFETAESDREHADSIERVLSRIAQGGLYQANLARCFEGRAEGSALALYDKLFADARVPFGFALDLEGGQRVCLGSPELCLEQRANGVLVTRPIKGTRPRGLDGATDLAQLTELASCPKERAELVMVVDLERNDLGKVSEPGSVEVLSAGEIETYQAWHHRVATVRSRLRDGVSRQQLLRAFLPSGSVTGAPKLAAMQKIASLERQRRGLYTGAVGYLGQDGGMRLAMAIRALVVEASGEAKYFAGGGIVADSRPEREVAETRWKSSQLLRANRGHASTAEATPVDARSPGQSLAENWADWLGSGT